VLGNGVVIAVGLSAAPVIAVTAAIKMLALGVSAF
jgi:hypothetical protein